MKRFINDVKKFFNYTVFSSKAELKSEVADSFLSWLWWILDPLLYMLVYAFVAGVIFGASSKPYFLVFVFITLIFTLCHTITIQKPIAPRDWCYDNPIHLLHNLAT